MKTSINLTPLNRAIRDALEAHYGDRLCQVLLFGSHARGEAAEDSDVDVAVVLEGPVDPYAESEPLSRLVPDFLERFGRYVSFKILSADSLEAGTWPFLKNLRQEGIPL